MEDVLVHSYWAIPDQMVAGPHPGSTNAEVAQATLGRLLDMQISAFIDLTEEGEWEAYEPLFAQLGANDCPSLRYRRESIRDQTIPSPEQMVRILDHIDELLTEGRVVYLHCLAGIGRTGTVLGCHLVRHGLSGEEALRHIAERRRALPYASLVSPETEAQRDFVRQWQAGQ